METAAVVAGKVRDPDRNVPRATLLGTMATAVVYMLALVAVFGVVPTDTLAHSSAPFSTAVNTIFGGTSWGDVMALVVIVSGIGALNGWTMVTAEMPRAAAQDGLFPERFQRVNRRGMPAFGIVASTALASLAMATSYLGLHLLLAKHRTRLLDLLGPVPHGGRRAPARNPRLSAATQGDDRSGPRPALPVRRAVTVDRGGPYRARERLLAQRRRRTANAPALFVNAVRFDGELDAAGVWAAFERVPHS